MSYQKKKKLRYPPLKVCNQCIALHTSMNLKIIVLKYEVWVTKTSSTVDCSMRRMTAELCWSMKYEWEKYCAELGTGSAVCGLTLHLEVLAVCLIAWYGPAANWGPPWSSSWWWWSRLTVVETVKKQKFVSCGKIWKCKEFQFELMATRAAAVWGPTLEMESGNNFLNYQV